MAHDTSIDRLAEFKAVNQVFRGQLNTLLSQIDALKSEIAISQEQLAVKQSAFETASRGAAERERSLQFALEAEAHKAAELQSALGAETDRVAGLQAALETACRNLTEREQALYSSHECQKALQLELEESLAAAKISLASIKHHELASVMLDARAIYAEAQVERLNERIVGMEDNAWSRYQALERRYSDEKFKIIERFSADILALNAVHNDNEKRVAEQILGLQHKKDREQEAYLSEISKFKTEIEAAKHAYSFLEVQLNEKIALLIDAQDKCNSDRAEALERGEADRANFDSAREQLLLRTSELQAALDNAVAREAQLTVAFRTLQEQSELTSHAANDMYGHLQGLQDHLRLVKASHSWVITKPLRSLKRLVTRSAAVEDDAVPIFTWPPEACQRGDISSRIAHTASSHNTESDPARSDIQITSLNELLKLSDLDFVYAMYHSILKREPDEGGLSHYLKRVRQGDDKRRIVFDIRTSSEGKLVNVTLPGLITRRSRLRAIASFYRLLWQKIIGKEDICRTVRILENQIGTLQARQSRYAIDPAAKSEASVDIKPRSENTPEMFEEALPMLLVPKIAISEGAEFDRSEKKTRRVKEQMFYDLVMGSE